MDARKPRFRRGEALPLNELSSKQFENFMYQCAIVMGPELGLTIVAGSSESADAGFDITARRIRDGRLACIQCKRLSKTFHLSMIGPELAKVALRSRLEGSEVVEHYIVTSSGVGETLRSALRERLRPRIIQSALKAVNNNRVFGALRTRAVSAGLDVVSTVTEYVQRLEKLEVWPGRELVERLAPVWGRIEPTIERFFAVEVVIREELSPDFDRERYLELGARSDRDFLPLRVSRAQLPANVSRWSNADPIVGSREASLVRTPEIEEVSVPVIETLVMTPIGDCCLLVGAGGGGKTTSLTAVFQRAASAALENPGRPLPIFLHLARYDGDLDRIIESTLRIHRGRWSSISESFLFLCDGLDEVPDGLAQRFLDDLGDLMAETRIAAVISLRNSGVRHQVSSPRVGPCWALRLLGMRDAVRIAEQELVGDDQQQFLDEFRRGLESRHPSPLALPFGVAVAIGVFRDTGHIPDSVGAFIDAVFSRRLRRNREEQRMRSLPPALREVNAETVRELASVVAFEVRIVRRRAAVSVAEAQAVAAAALANLKAASVFGAAALSDADAFTLAVHYEVLERLPNDTVRFAHDLFADRLASSRLAAAWRRHVAGLDTTLADDAWVFAAPLVPPEQCEQFLNAVAALDIVLAARCASSIGAGVVASLEPLVLALDESDEMLPAVRAATAMSVLGSEACVERLRQRAAEPARSHRWYQGKRGLALLGDAATLRVVLDEHDLFSSVPVRVSGGTLPLWWIAPPRIPLGLSRDKLDAWQGTQGLGLSLRTVAAYGDRSDIDRVLRVLHGTSSLGDFYAAGHCLYDLDSEAAVAALSAMLADPTSPNWLHCAELLSVHESIVDTRRVFDDWRTSGEAELLAAERHMKILLGHRLPPDAEPDLRSDYETAAPGRRSNIWRLATAHALGSFDNVASRILSTGEPRAELGLAADFVGLRTFPVEVDTPILDTVVRHAGSLDLRLENWHFDRILDLLLRRGRRQEAATLISRALTSIVPEFATLRRRRREEAAHAATLDDFRLQIALQGMLPLAAQVADLLPRALLKAIVSVDLTSMGDDAERAYLDIVERLRPEEVDEGLTEISDPDIRAPALTLASTLGSTPLRRALLASDLEALLRRGYTSTLVRAVANLWCREVAEVVVTLFARGEWVPNDGILGHHELINGVARLMTREFAEQIVSLAIGAAAAPEARQVLKLWYDLAMHRRA